MEKLQNRRYFLDEVETSGFFGTFRVKYAVKLITGLQIEPELSGGSEKFAQTDRGVRRDRPLAVHDFVDPARRDADFPRQSVLGNAQWLQKFNSKYLAGMDRRKIFFIVCHFKISSLVIIFYFDILRALIPREGDAPLDIDPYAEKPRPPLQFLEVISRRDLQVFRYGRGIQKQEFSSRRRLNLSGQFSGAFAVENRFRLLVLETFYHSFPLFLLLCF